MRYSENLLVEKAPGSVIWAVGSFSQISSRQNSGTLDFSDMIFAIYYLFSGIFRENYMIFTIIVLKSSWKAFKNTIAILSRASLVTRRGAHSLVITFSYSPKSIKVIKPFLSRLSQLPLLILG